MCIEFIDKSNHENSQETLIGFKIIALAIGE